MPLAEKSLIERIRRAAGASRRLVPLGIGDDTAVLRIPPGHEMLVTTDFSIEGVHFRRDWHSSGSIGYRCLARGLSDIAAMGGSPVAAFLSLALPGDLPQKWVDGFLRGLLNLARDHSVVLAGGDTAQSPGSPSEAKILADIVVVGSVPIGKAVRRSGAKPGNGIYVTGKLGASARALERMYAAPESRSKSSRFPAQPSPTPRLAVGRYLRQRGLASAMIDLSDGLSTDLDHLCRESGVGARIASELVPRAKGATLEQALHGGEDYELLFAAPSTGAVPKTIAGIAVTRIGEIRPRRSAGGVSLVDGAGNSRELHPRGWEHFVNIRHPS